MKVDDQVTQRGGTDALWLLGASDMETLPRGRHSLSSEEVTVSQRGRMMRAMALAVAEKGYGETVVTDVIERAHVSRKTFYEHFDDLQDCFRQAHAAAADAMVDAITAVYEEGADGGLEKIRRGVRVWFEMVSAQPEMAQAFFADAVSAGPAVARKRRENADRLGSLLVAAYERAREADPSLPEALPSAGLAANGAVNEICLAALADGKVAALPSRSDEVADLLVGLLTAGAVRSSS